MLCFIPRSDKHHPINCSVCNSEWLHPLDHNLLACYPHFHFASDTWSDLVSCIIRSFLRDIRQIIGATTMALLFLAPVFYPTSQIPEAYQTILHLNPLTLPIEQTRAVVLFGLPPDWTALTAYFGCGLVICWMGFWWFQKTRGGFADVL